AQMPGGGLLVVVPDDVDLSDLELATATRLDPANKIAPDALSMDGDSGYFLVEFHPDVARADAEGIVRESGFQVRENPDLAPDHVLVEGSPAALAALANWDEVAYIFVAS